MMKRIRQKITAALLILALVSGEIGQTGIYVRAEDGNGLTEYTEEYTEEDPGTADTGEQSGMEVENAGDETGTEENGETPGGTEGAENTGSSEGADNTKEEDPTVQAADADGSSGQGAGGQNGAEGQNDGSGTGTEGGTESPDSTEGMETPEGTEEEDPADSLETPDDTEMVFDTAAGQLLKSLLDAYFPDVPVGGLYDVILGMGTDTRLSLASAYENVLSAMTEEDGENQEFQGILAEIERGLADAAENEAVIAPAFYSVNPLSAPSTAVELTKLDGEGTAFMYYNFVETTEFQIGTTYAFLNAVYDQEDAVSMLGSGAILRAAERANINHADRYIKEWYGEEAEVTVYVDVVTKGKGFDHCQCGGLYTVPGTSHPTEYRYFCKAGGAQNCGPLYAYTYEEAELTYENVSASLNDINDQGSEQSEDYTVTLSYEEKQVVLDPSGYTVQTYEDGRVTIVVTDDNGNRITTNFQGPVGVQYEGNADEVSQVPQTQGALKGENVTLSSQEPQRAGYEFLHWQDQDGNEYAPGEVVEDIQRVLYLKAQWKDIQLPQVTCGTVEVMTRTSDAEVKAAVEKAVTVQDNEPVSECVIEVSENDIRGIAVEAGEKQVAVTVTDKAGNQVQASCTVYVIARPVSFDQETYNISGGQVILSATLVEPGGDVIEESGFVWGIMNNPTLMLNNGKQKTDKAVTEPDGVITVTAADLQKGVSYYGRAYITTEDGVTYYSDEISFGLGLPDYGTFTITNNNDHTFTVTRSGGSAGEQTVYYRTVNGSAAGGTHFTHQAGTLIFKDGETSKTITVAEAPGGANTAYSGRAATAYTNADRSYSVELYRVTGGGSLGEETTAVRTMPAADGYQVNRTIYTEENAKSLTSMDGISSPWWVTDRSGGNQGDIYWVSDRNQNTHPQKHNFNSSASVSDRYSGDMIGYILNTASSYLYRYTLGAHEDEDGYDHAWMGTHAPNNAGQETKLAGSYTTSPIALNDSVAGEALWTANFLVAEGHRTTKYYPTDEINQSEDEGNNETLRRRVYGYNAADNVLVSRNSNTYARIDIDQTVYNYFSASGANSDRWYVESFTDYMLIEDDREPEALSVAPMAGGLYKVGDTYTVSVVFDEIVDSQNSSLNDTDVYLETSWGRAYYAGGADTNVLYFTGTVDRNPAETLEVTGMAGLDRIRDMCDTSGTETVSISGSTSATVDAGEPDFTVAAEGIANGTGTAVVTVNEEQDNTSSLRYVWSDSPDMPVSGWVEASAEELSEAKGNGLTLGIRKEAGSGQSNGKWYLHVIGTYDTTGATTYHSAELDFGTLDAPAAGGEPPALTLSADNSNWATSRTITVSASASGDASLKYRVTSDTEWKSCNLTDKSVTVTENGYYTFLLTAGDQTIKQDVLVERIDRSNPTAVIGEPAEGSVATAKEGVYTAIALPVVFADGDSGVRTVQYQWTDSKDVPESGDAWQELPDISGGTADIVYTAAETTETVKYLHLRVTDSVGNTVTVTSDAFTVISQAAIDNYAPKISLTGAPSEWTNDMPTLIWKLSDYEGKDYTVTLPDGDTSEDTRGNFLATQNGTYTVKVTDHEYGGTNTATLEIDKLDLTAPVVTVSGISEDWKNSACTITVSASDSQSGVDKIEYAVVDSNEKEPEDSEFAELPKDGKITVNQNGTWYIYYKAYDKAGDSDPQIEREANIETGFSDPIRIDQVQPRLTVSGGTTGVSPADGLKLTLKAEYGVSGGKVTTDGQEIKDLSAEPVSSGTAITKSATYTVTAKGAYSFAISSTAGSTATETVNVYEAVLNAQNGTDAQSQIVVSGGTLAKPSDPVRQGYVFDGWYTEETGGVLWDFHKDTVSEDMTLYARWTARTDTKYTVNHWTQNMDGADTPYDDKNYTLAKTEERAGTTDSTLTLENLASDEFSGCSYSLGRVNGQTVTETAIQADGKIVIDLYYSRLGITGNVFITGQTLSKETLTANVSGAPKDAVLSYQWYYAGDDENQDIENATGSTYLLDDEDVGRKLGVRVTASTYKGELVSLPTDPVKANLSGSISIEGTMAIGSRLTVDKDKLKPSNATVAWQWYRVDSEGQETAIPGAQSDEYVLTAADYDCTMKVVATGTGFYQNTVSADTGTETVEKKTQAKPAGITHDDETIDNKNDGKIHGLDIDTMEYRMGTTGEYQAIPAQQFADGTLSGLADGIYQIRYKEKDEYKASEPVEVVIQKGGYYTVTLPETQTGYTLTFADDSDSQASHNGESSLVFRLQDGYITTDKFSITLKDSTKGKISGPEDGIYVISEITGNVEVTVTGVEDVTAPDLTVKSGNSEWREFLHAITFGLFFHETQAVEVTASDAGSGVDKVSYYLSETQMTQEQIKALAEEEWTEYTGVFYIAEEKNYIIYAKAVDRDGNTVCVSSEGIVLDWTPPELGVSGVPSGWQDEEQTVVFTPSDSGSGVANTWYKIVNTQEIPADGLSELPEDGKVTVSGDGNWYVYYRVWDKTAAANNGVDRDNNVTEGFVGPVRIDTKAPEITVSGGVQGAAAAEGLKITLAASYGFSGGAVTANGQKIDALSAGAVAAGTGTAENTKTTEYTVKTGGVYTFEIQSGTGKTETESVTVYEAALDAQNGSETQTQLVVSGGKLTRPEDPEKQGYTFAGWYTAEGTAWDFQKHTVTDETKLYARWSVNTDTRYPVTESGPTADSTGMNPSETDASNENRGENVSADAAAQMADNGQDLISYEEASGKTVSGPVRASYGEGTIQVTIESVDEQGRKEGNVITGVFLNTFDTVARAALTEEEFQAVQAGAHAEIRLVVTKLETEVPQEEQQEMEGRVNSLMEQIQGLRLGAYVDITLEKKIGDGDWQKLRNLNEELEIVLDIPKELLRENASYWVLRNHEGTCDLLEDLDEIDRTITIRTDRFSTYAILYTEQAQEKEAVCFWHWLSLTAGAAGALAAVFVRGRKKGGVWIAAGAGGILSLLFAAAGHCSLDWAAAAFGIIAAVCAAAFPEKKTAEEEEDKK